VDAEDEVLDKEATRLAYYATVILGALAASACPAEMPNGVRSEFLIEQPARRIARHVETGGS
jgi:hypothetical protein